MKERLVTADKAIEDGNTFRFEREFEQNVIIDREYFDRMLARRPCEPLSEGTVWQFAWDPRIIWRNDPCNRLTHCFLKAHYLRSPET